MGVDGWVCMGVGVGVYVGVREGLCITEVGRGAVCPSHAGLAHPSQCSGLWLRCDLCRNGHSKAEQGKVH